MTGRPPKNRQSDTLFLQPTTPVEKVAKTVYQTGGSIPLLTMLFS